MVVKTKVGIIGTGNIGPAYVKGCREFRNLEVVACADIDHERAVAFAQQYELKALTIQQLLDDPEIQIVINLTIPKVHADVSVAILEAGKHVHSEKPLAITREDAERVMKTAEQRGLRVGCAPDTFLGGGLQTCRKLIDDGWIGTPLAATGFMGYRGPDQWHPNPFFFYQTGGGPMLDMGPYYLTALVMLLGPVRRVTGATRASFPMRYAGHEAIRGTEIPVEVTTHLTGALNFASGAIGTLTTTFDIWSHNQPIIEIYGSEGTLRVPDPNTFKGPVQVYRPTDGEWKQIPLTHSDKVGRGIGVADMADAIVKNRPHRASGALAQHVLDVMLSFDEASDSGCHVMISTQPERPTPLPLGLAHGDIA
jgi:predicted dehydrogenase